MSLKVFLTFGLDQFNVDDKRFDSIENKVDTIQKSIHSIDITLAEQHVSLKEHMRRTSLLEKLIFLTLAALGALALAVLH